jgi:hypothetical protein
MLSPRDVAGLVVKVLEQRERNGNLTASSYRDVSQEVVLAKLDDAIANGSLRSCNDRMTFNIDAGLAANKER